MQARILRFEMGNIGDHKEVGAGVWVAEVGGHVAGFLALVDEPAVTLLENVAVHPDWQGRGIGRLLIELGEEHAKASDRSAVRLYTNAVMLENRRLYSHLGYTEVDRRMEDGFDRVFFEKSLADASGGDGR